MLGTVEEETGAGAAAISSGVTQVAWLMAADGRRIVSGSERRWGMKLVDMELWDASMVSGLVK